MKKTLTMAMLALVALAANAGNFTVGGVINADTATKATTVTGTQSNALTGAVAHTNRTDNPHAVTAGQVGAATYSGVTNAGFYAAAMVMSTGTAARATYATSSGYATNAGYSASTAYATNAANAVHATDATKLVSPLGADVWIHWLGSTGTIYRVEQIGISSGLVVTASANFGGITAPTNGAVFSLSSTDGEFADYLNVWGTITVGYALPTTKGTGGGSETEGWGGSHNWITGNMECDGATCSFSFTYAPICSTNTTALVDAAMLADALAAYPTAVVTTNIANGAVSTHNALASGVHTAAGFALASSLPASGCTANGAGMTLVITGAPPPIAWQAAPTNALAVTVAANAPRNRFYSITTIGKAVSSWPANSLVSTNTSGTSPFLYAIGPYTGTLWQVVGGGR